MRKPVRITAIAGVVGALMAAVTLVAPAAAAAPARALPCRATMSNYHPADYTTVTVRVRTAAFARVRTVAHKRTENTTKHRRANAEGRARLPYYISGATPGYRVKVSVTVRKGTRTGSCHTAFTPHQ